VEQLDIPQRHQSIGRRNKRLLEQKKAQQLTAPKKTWGG
jgi:hypothetical protein